MSYKYMYCTSLTSITIPGSVTSIGNGAFSEDNSLTSVTICDGVTSIGNGAFECCTSLTSITIPNSVTSIGSGAFNYCKSLTSITIGKGVTSIGNDAFKECSALKTVNRIIDIAEWCQKEPITYGNELSNPMYGVDYNEYYYDDAGKELHLYSDYDTEIKDLIIPEGVVSIRSSAFAICRGLTSVTFPQSLTTVGGQPFAYCPNLTKATFHCKTIGNWLGWGYWYDEWEQNWHNPIKEVFIGEEVTSITAGVFERYKNLSTVSVNSNTIGAWFNNLTSLKTVIIGDNTTSISDSAFENCSGLTSLTIGKNVKTIGNSAFSGCSMLPSVVLPNGTTSIGTSSFANCSALSSMQLPNGLTSIGNSAFTSCTSLANILLPNSLTTIGSSAFSECSALTEIMLPVGIKTIEDSTFSGCSALASIQYPNALTSIGSSAFQGCGFTELSVPSTVNSIGDNAYKNCAKLNSVTIPSSVTTIGYGVFAGCSKLSTVSIDCKTIGTCLSGLTSLKTVTIGENATSIGESAFANCSGLTNLTIGKNVKSIGGSTFLNCSSLESIALSSNLTSLGSSAFSGCRALTSITIPSGIKTIESSTFKGCSKLASIQIPNETTSIGSSTFYGCSVLNTITLPSSLTSLGSSAFQNCSGLTSIALPDGIKSIDNQTFAGCSSLSSIQYSKTLTSIGSSSFQGCAFTEITIPSTVTSIGSNAYYGCSKLTSAVIPSSVTTIGTNVFAGCSKLATLSVDCKSIGTWFSGLTAIKELTIGSSTTSISASAFANCTGIETLSIGKNVTAIGYSAFSKCNKLAVVKTFIEQPYWIDASVFEYALSSTTTLYVPKGKAKDYKNLSCWNQFPKIIEMDGEENDDEEIAEGYDLCGTDIEARVGSNGLLPIELTNEDEVKLCQFDLHLPVGVTVATKSNGKLDAKLTERAENHSISSQRLSNGDYRFIVSSLDNESFTGNSGTLMEIALDVASTMEAGEYTVKVLNAELSVPDGNDLKVVRTADTESKLTVKAYTPGDVNNDGSVSVTDVGCAINYILEQVPSVFVFEAADMNGDKSVSVTDVGMIINLILNEGAASRPFFARGTSEDILSSNASLQPTNNGYQFCLENKELFIGFQFDVELVGDANIEDLKLADADENDHLLTYRRLNNGKWRVVCYSPTNSTFAGYESILLNIQTAGGVNIDNIRLTTLGLHELHPAALTSTPTGIASMKQDMKVSVQGGTLCITSDRDATLRLLSLDGKVIRYLNVYRGQNNINGLCSGIYLINNQKIIIR